MNSVAFVGIKGGNGATTSSHLLCLGAAWNGRPAYLLHTDIREPAEVSPERPYRYIDARNSDVLTQTYNKLVEASGDHLAVIDSGGNRENFDKFIAPAVDLVVIPTDLDNEAVKLAIKQAKVLSEIAKVRILVRCPLKLGRDDQKEFDRIPKELLLGRVDVVKGSKRLKADDEDGWKTPPSNVNNLARKVHSLVFDFFNPPIEL